MSLATTPLPPGLDLERITRHNSDFTLPCPAISDEELNSITDLFKECFDKEQFHFLPEKWETHKAAIKSSFQLIEGYVKPTLEKVPSLNDLVEEAAIQALPSASVTPPGSPKGKKPDPIPDQIVNNHRLAEILGYYKAMKVQIDDLEASSYKPFDLNDLLSELLHILGIDDLEEKKSQIIRFFQTQFETIQVKGDGNCLPRAIVRALKNHGDATYGQWAQDDEKTEFEMASKLRRDLIEFMRNDKDDDRLDFISAAPSNDCVYEVQHPFEDFVRNNPYLKPEEQRRLYEEKRYEDCLEEIALNGCYFSGEFIKPLAKMLKGYTINIYAPGSTPNAIKNGMGPVQIVKGQIVPNQNFIFGKGPKAIHILQVEIGQHYWLLNPKTSHA